MCIRDRRGGITAACLFAVLVCGWLVSRVVRAKAEVQVPAIESLISIVAGIGCLVVLYSPIAGSVLIVVGLAAPTVTKYFGRLQPATATDPIAIAPTMKQ